MQSQGTKHRYFLPGHTRGNDSTSAACVGWRGVVWGSGTRLGRRRGGGGGGGETEIKSCVGGAAADRSPTTFPPIGARSDLPSFLYPPPPQTPNGRRRHQTRKLSYIHLAPPPPPLTPKKPRWLLITFLTLGRREEWGGRCDCQGDSNISPLNVERKSKVAREDAAVCMLFLFPDPIRPRNIATMYPRPHQTFSDGEWRAKSGNGEKGGGLSPRWGERRGSRV